MLKDPRLLPWHQQAWQQLMKREQQHALPHALLFVGASGLGKKKFAEIFSQALLCIKSEVACGDCHSCHLFQAQSHPDFLLVEPEKIGGIIKVEQIREAVQFVSETALQGRQRIIIIQPANAMNVNSANALLKTLEEPAPNTLIILICDQNLRLLPTIKSRCQKIIFQKPARAAAINWLQNNTDIKKESLPVLLNLAAGAPLRAQELLSSGEFELRQKFYQALAQLAEQNADPLQLAVQYQEQDAMILLNFLLIWLRDLLYFKLNASEAELINTDYVDVFAKLSILFSLEKLTAYLDQATQRYQSVAQALNLNKQLLWEELFIRWMCYAAR